MRHITKVFILMLALACTKKAEDYPNLIINDLKLGQGDEVGSFDTIYVHFEGRFKDGRIFDSSKARGNEPIRYSMRAKSLIEGWRLGLVGMKEGGIRRLTIPPELAFGSKGKANRIPANETLIFDVELIRTE
jgi:peptidylprolyl isomerase